VKSLSRSFMISTREWKPNSMRRGNVGRRQLLRNMTGWKTLEEGKKKTLRIRLSRLRSG
jgi:hypothetical protein